ncbi:hypothetical protein BIS47_101 [Klebsiella phage vB_KpnM_BIS47]|uniref:Uncharacterized protein n=2 Tax=Caudoviricetes TaxID=2731619 RepID=A0A1V0E6U5_9CAUD|nr:hypothetical protein BIS47_101 [Klebsiella phage vB_KpnM_BIS47]ARB12605.1 hypothetical protein BIS47_101 [Klebsiella phage vB_KpnM_BIS47]
MSEKMIQVPASIIAELVPYINSGLRSTADEMGKAGHTPSEVMSEDYDRFNSLRRILRENGVSYASN